MTPQSRGELPGDIPPEAMPFLREMDYFAADRLGVGDRVPTATLRRLDGGESVTIGADAARPTVLVFGSYT